MKIKITFLFFCLFSLSCIGQTHLVIIPPPKAKSELKELGLDSNVKSVRETSYQAIYKSGQIQKGKRKREKSFYSNEDFNIAFSEKEEKNEKEEYKSDGSLDRKLTYKHDEKGNVTEEARYGIGNVLINKSSFTYKYDEKGNMIEKCRYGNDGSLNAKFIFSYDGKNNKITQQDFDSKGNLMSIDSMKYDDKNNLIEIKALNIDKNHSGFRITYKYDEKGNEIEENWYNPKSKFVLKYIFKYDDRGNNIEVDWCEENGKVYTTWTIEYEFDKNGNWIKQVQFKNAKPIYIIEREIEYF